MDYSGLFSFATHDRSAEDFSASLLVCFFDVRASSLARSWASAYALAPHRRSDAARAESCDAAAASSFSSQLFVRDALTACVFDKAVQPIKGMAFHVAIIEPERELVNVARQVFLAHLMV